MKYILSILGILLSLSAQATIYEAQCSGTSAGKALQFSAVKMDSIQSGKNEHVLGTIGSFKVTLAVGEGGAAGPFDLAGIKVEDGLTMSYSGAPMNGGVGYIIYGAQSKETVFQLACSFKAMKPL